METVIHDKNVIDFINEMNSIFGIESILSNTPHVYDHQ